MRLSKGIPRVVAEVPKKKNNRRNQLSKDSSHKLSLRSALFGLGSFVNPSELSPEIGDLVQVDRVLYTEWVLFVGHENVVHLCSLDSENEIPADGFANVKLSSLISVAGPSGVRVNNKVVGAKDRNLEPLLVETVIQNGMALVGKTVEFNLLTKNSEHYVTDWKYGHGWSDQALVTMNVMRTLTKDGTVDHSVLVNSLNAVLNSPASPISRSPPKFNSRAESK